MNPYYADLNIKIYNGDCRQMTELADNSVQCVVTSPPYWGLRKYSGEQELIWGDNHCDHQWGKEIVRRDRGTVVNSDVVRQPRELIGASTPQGNFCSLCGAWKGAYGLEPTPEMYAQHTIEILREIRRVLRKDGVVFWNIGDSYYGSGGDHKEGGKNDAGFQGGLMRGVQAKQQKHSLLKPKDLCLLPFRIALEAQRDGWWVRSVIIWSKPNPMPESVTDRPTESHEYILMLTKSARYYWDADAVREPHTESTLNRVEYGLKHRHPDDVGIGIPPVNTDKMGDRFAPLAGRNIRSVWEFPTQPYPEAHFAVFPEKLPELCIKAATPEVGCCSKCGAPWERVLGSKETLPVIDYGGKVKELEPNDGTRRMSGHLRAIRIKTGTHTSSFPQPQTLGWQPICKCGAEATQSVVLDPFAGAGTTLWVAKKLNRRAVGYEISQEYCELALERNRQQVLL